MKVAMEVVSISLLFFTGDGDIKFFDQICKSDLYPGHTITKGACAEHVQKRVGAHLHRIKKQLQREKFL